MTIWSVALVDTTLIDADLLNLFVEESFQRAFRLLLEANLFARHVSSNPWEFAVRIQQLCRLGLTENELRLLVHLKLLDHAHEVTTYRDEGRVFRAHRNLLFTNRTCFLLAPQGAALARCAISAPSSRPSDARRMPSQIDEKRGFLERPLWDSQSRTLSLSGQMIKQFRSPAVNQEQVLSAFQEEHWPKRILDPLAPHPGLDVKRRLSDTIKCLNRGHLHALLRFHGDGTGEGVLWEAAS